MKVLIVDDDPKFRAFVHRGLDEHGIESRAAESAERAEAELESNSQATFDLILLDVMMPGRSGWEFLESLRARGDETPVIFLTARHDVSERVKGLELGADDYVLKPFELSELLARMHAVMRRRKSLPVRELGQLRIDLGRRSVQLRGQSIEMSPREFDLLNRLAERPGQVLTRRELLRSVWSIDFDPGTNLVDVLVGRVRRRIDRDGSNFIETVVGEGYRLNIPETSTP